MSVQDVFIAKTGSWVTKADWSDGLAPTSADDAFIGFTSPASATSDQNETVASIGTNIGSVLAIGDDSTFTATDGTILSPSDTSRIGTGNHGEIDIDVGSTLAIGSTTTFENDGVIDIGVAAATGWPSGALTLGGVVTLDGGGTVNLNASIGAGVYGTLTGATLINVDNEILGGGVINLTTLDNQAKGTIEAPEGEDVQFDVSAVNFTNEGAIVSENHGELNLGQDGATRTLVNTGSVTVDAGADVEMEGNFTLSGSGALALMGAGAAVLGDGGTVTNSSTIEDELGAGQIGDQGKLIGGALMTFVNAGTVIATGASTLTLDTDTNAIGDGGGTLEAENGGVMVINSTVDTGVVRVLSHPSPGGTVEALTGGIVRLAASIVDGVTGLIRSTNGQVVLNGGTFDMLAGSSDTATVEFTGLADILELDAASTAVGALSTFADGDIIELKGFDAATIESVADEVLTVTDGNLSQTFDLEGATYATGQFADIQLSGGFAILSLQSAFSGGGLSFDLAAGSASLSLSNSGGDFDAVYGSHGTVSLSAAQAEVTGGGDTVNFSGGSDDAVTVSNTANVWDSVNGSGGTVYFESGQAVVTGGDDTVDFYSGTGNAATVTGTAGDWDLVEGAAGTVYLSSGQANVIGGGFTLDFVGGSGNVVSLASTGGDFDVVDGSGGTVYLTSAQTLVSGGGDTVNFHSGSGNAVTVSNTANVWDSVNGSGGTVYLVSGQAGVIGGGNTVDFYSGTGNAATVTGTAGDWDLVEGAAGTVYLSSGQANVIGGGFTLDFFGGSGNVVSLASTGGDFDAVDGSGGAIYLTSAQTLVSGGGDTVTFSSGSGNAVTVSNTANVWDSVNGSGGTVYLIGGQAVVTGGGDTVDFISGSGNAVTVSATANIWDSVNGSGGTVYLTSGQAAVSGGGNTVDFISGSGNAASLYSTDGASDGVNGSNGTVNLFSAQASVIGSSDTIHMNGTSSMTQSGASDAFVFQPAIGVETINGFASTDSMQFSASDFANFGAMKSHTTQSGSATLIALDGSDKVTLTNTLDTSLVASQFHFV